MFLGNDIETIIYLIPILLFAIAVHEASHAYVAYKLGDRSQKYMGRMTLDPMKHFDPFGFICIVLIGFGWGKPVLVDDSQFEDRSKGNMLVSLAGPVSNLLLSIIFAVIIKVLMTLGVPLFTLIGDTYFVAEGAYGILANLLLLGVQFNIILAVFNLLPIPPFDGSKILRHFLPYNLKIKYDSLQRYTFFIIMLIAFTGIAGAIISPIVDFIFGIMQTFILL